MTIPNKLDQYSNNPQRPHPGMTPAELLEMERQNKILKQTQIQQDSERKKREQS